MILVRLYKYENMVISSHEGFVHKQWFYDLLLLDHLLIFLMFIYHCSYDVIAFLWWNFWSLIRGGHGDTYGKKKKTYKRKDAGKYEMQENMKRRIPLYITPYEGLSMYSWKTFNVNHAEQKSVKIFPSLLINWLRYPINYIFYLLSILQDLY